MVKNIEIKGQAAINKALNKLIAKSENAARIALGKTVLTAIGDAKEKAKVKTVRLRTSIIGAMSGMANPNLKGKAVFQGQLVTNLPIPKDKFIAIIGTDVDYGPDQEFGSKGKPYLRPAGKRAVGNLKRAIKAQFRKLKI